MRFDAHNMRIAVDGARGVEPREVNARLSGQGDRLPGGSAVLQPGRRLQGAAVCVSAPAAGGTRLWGPGRAQRPTRAALQVQRTPSGVANPDERGTCLAVADQLLVAATKDPIR